MNSNGVIGKRQQLHPPRREKLHPPIYGKSEIPLIRLDQKGRERYSSFKAAASSPTSREASSPNIWKEWNSANSIGSDGKRLVQHFQPPMCRKGGKEQHELEWSNWEGPMNSNEWPYPSTGSTFDPVGFAADQQSRPQFLFGVSRLIFETNNPPPSRLTRTDGWKPSESLRVFIFSARIAVLELSARASFAAATEQEKNMLTQESEKWENYLRQGHFPIMFSISVSWKAIRKFSKICKIPIVEAPRFARWSGGPSTFIRTVEVRCCILSLLTAIMLKINNTFDATITNYSIIELNLYYINTSLSSLQISLKSYNVSLSEWSYNSLHIIGSSAQGVPV